MTRGRGEARLQLLQKEFGVQVEYSEVQVEYSQLQVEYEWSTAEVQWNTAGVQVEYALLESRFSPLGYMP
jgi:hypothetical protein